MNGLSTEEESSSSHQDQTCCLVDAGERCIRLAGNAAYNKRIQRLVSQRKLRLHSDSSVSVIFIFFKQGFQASAGGAHLGDSLFRGLPCIFPSLNDDPQWFLIYLFFLSASLCPTLFNFLLVIISDRVNSLMSQSEHFTVLYILVLCFKKY